MTITDNGFLCLQTILEPDLLSLLKQLEKQTKYTKQPLSDTGHQAAEGSAPERGETHEASPRLSQLAGWREFPGHGAGIGNLGRAQWSP